MSRRLEILEYLGRLNGNSQRLDQEIRAVVSSPTQARSEVVRVRRGMDLWGDAGLPGLDRDGQEVLLFPGKGEFRGRPILRRPNGEEHPLDTYFWAAAIHNHWLRS